MKNLFLVLLLSLPTFVNAQGQGAITARFIDKSTGLPIDSLKIILKGNYVVYDTISNTETSPHVFELKTVEKSSTPIYNDSLFADTSRWRSPKIPEGVYVMTVEKTGYQPATYSGIIIHNNYMTYFDNPPVELLPIGYVAPKPEKVTQKKKHKKKH